MIEFSDEKLTKTSLRIMTRTRAARANTTKAAKQLAVQEAWLRVENTVAPDELADRKGQIHADLEKIYQDLRTLAESGARAKAVAELSAVSLPKAKVRRILLQPPRARAWIPRILFFYGYTISAAVAVVRSLVSPTGGDFCFARC